MRRLSALLAPRIIKFNTSVEWSPKVASAALQSQIHQTGAPTPASSIAAAFNGAVSHCVFPDIPKVLTSQDKEEFLLAVPLSQRIVTVAVCRHTPATLVAACTNAYHADDADDVWKEMGTKTTTRRTFLLVGGNDKTTHTLSTVQACNILREHDTCNDAELWGVANPNDPASIERVREKLEAGIQGFITQPLLSSHAHEILRAYPRRLVGGGDRKDGTGRGFADSDDTKADSAAAAASFVIGVAMPTSVKSLLFWSRQLLEQPNLEKDDSLFQKHIRFFSQPGVCSPLSWVEQELDSLRANPMVGGFHFMPLGNTKGLVQLLSKQATTQFTQPP